MSVDLARAVELIAARAEKAGKKVAGPSAGKKKAAGKKAPARKKASGKGKAAASASADE